MIKSSGDLNLGKAPRQAYPLVVFLIKADCENENLDDTVSIHCGESVRILWSDFLKIELVTLVELNVVADQ